MTRTDAIADDLDATWYPAFAVLLVVEVVSAHSEVRDRERKPQLYSAAGIEHFWLAENIDHELVVTTYRLTDGSYSSTGTHRGSLDVDAPFRVVIDLTDLAR